MLIINQIFLTQHYQLFIFNTKFYSLLVCKTSSKIEDNSKEKRDRPNAYIELPRPEIARYLKFENIHVPMPNLAISDKRFFGNGNETIPATPDNLKVKRDKD